MVRSFADYEELVEGKMPAVLRDVFEDNYDEDDYDDAAFILVSPDCCVEFGDRFELINGLDSYDRTTQLMVIANNDYGGGCIIVGNADDIKIDL